MNENTPYIIGYGGLWLGLLGMIYVGGNVGVESAAGLLLLTVCLTFVIVSWKLGEFMGAELA